MASGVRTEEKTKGIRRLGSIVALAMLPALSGCRSLSLRGEQVRTTKHETDVADCKPLGTVSQPPPYVGPNDAENGLRNKAAALGGDVVLTSYGFGSATGKVYDCGGRFSPAK